MTSRPRSPLMLTCVLVGVVLGACGVSADAKPNALPQNQFPKYLVDPQQSVRVPGTTSSPGSTVPPVDVPVDVFFVGTDGHLRSTSRSVPAFPDVLDNALSALASGPTASELSAGITSYLPAGMKVISTSISSGLATIDMDSSFLQSNPVAQLYAVAQMVYTSTGVSGVDNVTFQVQGGPVHVAVSDGSLQAVTDRADFSPVSPPS